MRSVSLTTLVEAVVDYAGLFPPAALPMSDAVRAYAEYANSADAWMLGRFIVPAARLAEFEREAAEFLPAGSPPWRLSVLCGSDISAEVSAINQFNKRTVGARVDSLEFKAERIDEITAASTQIPPTLLAFVEIPVHEDVYALVCAISNARFGAKVRTGGVTPDAFPASSDLARFIHACVEVGVPFKATAGLHHPVRAVYNLTYESDSKRSMMFGHLNLLLAAVFAKKGLGIDETQLLLEEESSSAFLFDDAGVSWRGHRMTTAEIQQARCDVVLSFGSCSFREPVDDLKTIHLM